MVVTASLPPNSHKGVRHGNNLFSGTLTAPAGGFPGWLRQLHTKPIQPRSLSSACSPQRPRHVFGNLEFNGGCPISRASDADDYGWALAWGRSARFEAGLPGAGATNLEAQLGHIERQPMPNTAGCVAEGKAENPRGYRVCEFLDSLCQHNRDVGCDRSFFPLACVDRLVRYVSVFSFVVPKLQRLKRWVS